MINDEDRINLDITNIKDLNNLFNNNKNVDNNLNNISLNFSCMNESIVSNRDTYSYLNNSLKLNCYNSNDNKSNTYKHNNSSYEDIDNNIKNKLKLGRNFKKLCANDYSIYVNKILPVIFEYINNHKENKIELNNKNNIISNSNFLKTDTNYNKEFLSEDSKYKSNTLDNNYVNYINVDQHNKKKLNNIQKESILHKSSNAIFYIDKEFLIDSKSFKIKNIYFNENIDNIHNTIMQLMNKNGYIDNELILTLKYSDKLFNYILENLRLNDMIIHNLKLIKDIKFKFNFTKNKFIQNNNKIIKLGLKKKNIYKLKKFVEIFNKLKTCETCLNTLSKFPSKYEIVFNLVNKSKGIIEYAKNTCLKMSYNNKILDCIINFESKFNYYTNKSSNKAVEDLNVYISKVLSKNSNNIVNTNKQKTIIIDDSPSSIKNNFIYLANFIKKNILFHLITVNEKEAKSIKIKVNYVSSKEEIASVCLKFFQKSEVKEVLNLIFKLDINYYTTIEENLFSVINKSLLDIISSLKEIRFSSLQCIIQNPESNKEINYNIPTNIAKYINYLLLLNDISKTIDTFLYFIDYTTDEILKSLNLFLEISNKKIDENNLLHSNQEIIFSKYKEQLILITNQTVKKYLNIVLMYTKEALSELSSYNDINIDIYWKNQFFAIYLFNKLINEKASIINDNIYVINIYKDLDRLIINFNKIYIKNYFLKFEENIILSLNNEKFNVINIELYNNRNLYQELIDRICNKNTYNTLFNYIDSLDYKFSINNKFIQSDIIEKEIDISLLFKSLPYTPCEKKDEGIIEQNIINSKESLSEDSSKLISINGKNSKFIISTLDNINKISEVIFLICILPNQYEFILSSLIKVLKSHIYNKQERLLEGKGVGVNFEKLSQNHILSFVADLNLLKNLINEVFNKVLIDIYVSDTQLFNRDYTIEIINEFKLNVLTIISEAKSQIVDIYIDRYHIFILY